MADWRVALHPKITKKIPTLPKQAQKALVLLMREIELNGPVRGNWPNYGKLGADRHHCHLKKGQPTYVAVWEVKNASIRLVEMNYVGTHERAPY